MLATLTKSATHRVAWMALLSGILLGTTGCPIDRDEVITESVRGALQAATNSIVQALTEYLAAN